MNWTSVFLILLLFVSGFGCAHESTRPITYYAEIDVERLDAIAAEVRDVAARHDLRVFEKSRNEMRVLNGGVDAVFLALYSGDKQVLVITNVGYGTELLLAVTPRPNFSPARANELAHEMKAKLEKGSVGARFEKQGSEKQ
jgi:hypothetical protein